MVNFWRVQPVNFWVAVKFWGLSKPPRRPSDPLVALDRACERYHGNVEALVKEGVTDDNRSQVVVAIRKHAQVMENLSEKVA